MVFAFFAAADKAVGAVNNFKSSTVHNKELSVEVLPIIHVSSRKCKSIF